MHIDTKPEMSDAQYRAAEAVTGRGTDLVQRYRDTRTVTTLIAMARAARGWAVLRWDTIDGRRQIVGADLTIKGRKVFDRETTRRAAAIAHQRAIDTVLARTPVITGQGPAAGTAAAATRSIIDRADPLLVLTTGRPRTAAGREVHPDSPYFDEIPF